jgi:hypothetical protein
MSPDSSTRGSIASNRTEEGATAGGTVLIFGAGFGLGEVLLVLAKASRIARITGERTALSLLWLLRFFSTLWIRYALAALPFTSPLPAFVIIRNCFEETFPFLHRLCLLRTSTNCKRRQYFSNVVDDR